MCLFFLSNVNREPGSVRRSRICRTEDAIAKRLVKSVTGTGAIHAGDVLLRTTTYELSVWADDRQPASDKDLEAGASIEGSIDITGIAEAVVWAEAATLLHARGARWPDAFKRSIGVALKDEEDLTFISGRLDALIAEAAA